MIKYYKDIFKPEQCEHVANGMLRSYLANKTVKDNTSYSNGALGFYDLKEANDLLFYLDKTIKKDYGHNIRFANSYTRIYSNGNCLRCHTDRTGLDVTISICVMTNLSVEWPLYISDTKINVPWNDNLPVEEYKRNAKPYHTPVGSGVACIGKENPHWRDTLVCKEDEKVIQVFYHWKFTNA